MLSKIKDVNASEIEEIEKVLSEGKVLKVRAEDRINTLANSYKEETKKLNALGINIKTAEADLEAKKQLLNEKMKKVSELVPTDMIEKYKTYDFSGAKNTDEPNTKMPF